MIKNLLNGLLGSQKMKRNYKMFMLDPERKNVIPIQLHVNGKDLVADNKEKLNNQTKKASDYSPFLEIDIPNVMFHSLILGFRFINISIS